MKPLFLIDCDGVMLDYNQAFKEYYEKIYNKKLYLTNPKSYHAVNVWGVGKMSSEEYIYFKKEMAKNGMWENMPALPDALEFVKEISKYFTVWCLTSMPTEYENDRLKNLKKLGFPIERVIATSRIADENPKKKFVDDLQPMYFLDDLRQNFKDISHRKTKFLFLQWNHEDSPNDKYKDVNVDYTLNHYNDFFQISDFYLQQRKELNIKLNLEGTGFYNHLDKEISLDLIPLKFETKNSFLTLKKKYEYYSLENEFTENDYKEVDKIVEEIKKELFDWNITYSIV